MIYLSLLFWAALAIPGFALITRLHPRATDCGFLATLSLSYLAVFGLLAPVSVLGFLAGVPLPVFAVLVVGLVVAGFVDLTRRRLWPEARRLLVSALGLELVLLMADAVIGGMNGAHLGGDAILHLARVREIMDHGLVNTDPFVPGEHFYVLYHTNLWHTLIASCAWVTGLEHFTVWFTMLPFAKVLIAGGGAYLTWAVFERRWAAWGGALFLLGTQFPVHFLVYPNKLAPFWLLPMIFGLVVRATRGETRRHHVLLLAGAILVTSQFHGLYGVFAVILAGPVLLVATIRRYTRGADDRKLMLAALATLFLAVPLPVVSKLKRERAPDKDYRDFDALRKEKGLKPIPPPRTKVPAQIRQMKNGWMVKQPFTGFAGGKGFRLPWLFLGIALAVFSARRREALTLVAIIVCGSAILYVPPLFTWLAKATGASWSVLRLETAMFPALFAALVPGALLYHGERWIKLRWQQALLSMVVFAAAIPYSGVSTWEKWTTWMDMATVREGEWSSRVQIDVLRSQQKLLVDTIPSGSTILVEGRAGMVAVMLHDVHVLDPIRGSISVPTIVRMRYDNDLMLAEETPWDVRREALSRRGIRYFIPTSIPRWPEGHIKRIAREEKEIPPRLNVVELDL